LNRRSYPFIAIAACAGALGCGSVSEDPAANCEEPLGSALELSPTQLTIRLDPNPCVPATSVLLINQSDETIRIDAFQTGNFVLDSDSPQDGEGELVASAELPQELAPSDSLAIDLVFVSETPEITGTVELAVLTSKGCERFTVGAAHPGFDQPAIAHPLAVDVATTSPGTLGEPVDIVFTPSAQNDDTWFMAGGVSTEVFQVVNPIDPTLLRSCEPLRASVRFDAPLETGVYEGELFYEILTDTQSGIGVVFLRARVQ
jgi:hypothetical protein